MITASSIDCLSLFVGEWAGEEIIAPSKWGAGGVASSRISARKGLNHYVLTQDYRAVRDGKPWLEVHAVFTFDEQNATYRLFWFDSLGFVPEIPALGQWDGEKLMFIRTSPRGKTRHTYDQFGDESYRLILESSFDDGKTWSRVMHGSYTRTS